MIFHAEASTMQGTPVWCSHNHRSRTAANSCEHTGAFKRQVAYTEAQEKANARAHQIAGVNARRANAERAATRVVRRANTSLVFTLIFLAIVVAVCSPGLLAGKHPTWTRARKDSARQAVITAQAQKEAAVILAVATQQAELAEIQARELNACNIGAKGERNSRSIPEKVKRAVWIRDGGKCIICGSTEDLQYDHKVPWSKGGSATVNNIQLMCGFHNRLKSDKEVA